MRSHSHDDIKTNKLWPPQELAEKYANCFTLNENIWSIEILKLIGNVKYLSIYKCVQEVISDLYFNRL